MLWTRQYGVIKKSRGPPPLLFIALLIDKVLTPEIFKKMNLKNVGVFEVDVSIIQEPTFEDLDRSRRFRWY